MEKVEFQEIIDLIDSNCEENRWSRVRHLEKHLKAHKDQTCTDFLALQAEFILFNYSYQNPKDPFQPILSATNEKGEQVGFHNSEIINKAHLEHYRKRAKLSPNCITQAAYSDILWMNNREQNDLTLAIESYIEASKEQVRLEWYPEAIFSIQRAFVLSLSTKSAKGLKNCIKVYLDSTLYLYEEKKYGLGLDAVKFLFNYRKKLNSEVSWALLLNKIQDFLYSKPYNSYLDFIDLQDQFYFFSKVFRYLNENKKCETFKRKFIASKLLEIRFREQNNFEEPSILSGLYSKVIEEYNFHNIPLSNRFLTILTKKFELNSGKTEKNLKKVSIPVTIPEENVDKQINIIKQLKTKSAIGYLISNGSFRPNFEYLGKIQTESHGNSFLNHIPVQIYFNGVPGKTVSDEKELSLLHTVQNYFRCLHVFLALFLEKTLGELQSRQDFEATLIEIIDESEIINEDRKKILINAVKLHNKKEYTASIHLMVLQIEGCMRDFLTTIEIPITTKRKKDNSTIFKGLPEIINYFIDIKFMDLEFLLFIKYFLFHEFGPQLRDNIAHSLLKSDSFTNFYSLTLLMATLRLCASRVEEVPGSS